jgi:glutamyl-tRNA synthetase
MKPVRTRFAPSPTGFLHVGGVRTALFSYLLAKRCGGKFILRIEDTDQQRKVPGAVRQIIDDLRWLGIEIDEGPSTAELEGIGESGVEGIGGSFGPYIQSNRVERYREVAEHLLSLGLAYRSSIAADTSWKERKGGREAIVGGSAEAIRFRIPRDRKVSVDDAIRGQINWESLSLNDPVILKSDGFPTYHLAVVVDDHDMEISHVLRGEEWIPTTPIHVMLYDALGWEKPVFAHPASVLGADGKKLSKRHGATGVSSFREAGYLPEALLNFLALIGWAPGEGEVREIFSKEEIAARFSLEHVHSSAGVFAYDKLDWMNAQYLRALTGDELAERLIPYLLAAGHDIESNSAREQLRFIAPYISERIERLDQAPPLLEFLFKKPFVRELEQLFSKHVTPARAPEILDFVANKLETLPSFSRESVDQALKDCVAELNLPMGAIFIAVRIAVTGKKITPPLVESIIALGQQETSKRLRDTISLVKEQP